MTQPSLTDPAHGPAAGADASVPTEPGWSVPPPTARRVGEPLADPSLATVKLYAGDWQRFAAWCRAQRCTPLPASANTMASYLRAIAPGLSHGALGRHRAAIRTMHRQSGLPVPSVDAATRKMLRSSARPKAASRAVPLTPTALQRMASRCLRDVTGLRDRALLLLVAALSRSERRTAGDPGVTIEARATGAAVPRRFLLALDAEHVRFTGAGMTIKVRVRADQTEPARSVTLSRSMTTETCPVQAMEDWLRVSDTAFGPVFRKVDRWGNVEHGRLSPDAWNRIVARRGDGPRRPRAIRPKTR